MFFSIFTLGVQLMMEKRRKEIEAQRQLLKKMEEEAEKEAKSAEGKRKAEEQKNVDKKKEKEEKSQAYLKTLIELKEAKKALEQAEQQVKIQKALDEAEKQKAIQKALEEEQEKQRLIDKALQEEEEERQKQIAKALEEAEKQKLIDKALEEAEKQKQIQKALEEEEDRIETEKALADLVAKGIEFEEIVDDEENVTEATTQEAMDMEEQVEIVTTEEEEDMDITQESSEVAEKYASAQSMTRVTAMRWLNNYNEKKDLRPYPSGKVFDTSDSSVYTFEGEGKTLSDIRLLDKERWISETSGKVNDSHNMKMWTYVGRAKDGERERWRKRQIFHDTTSDQYIVHYTRKPTPGEKDKNVQVVQEIAVDNPKKAMPHCIKNDILLPKEVHDLFQQSLRSDDILSQNKDKFVENPKAGEVLIFDIREMGKNWERNFYRDSYRWKRQPTVIQVWDNKYQRTKSNAMTFDEEERKYRSSRLFTRYEYEDTNRNVGMFHYVGSEKAITRGPHLNSNTQTPFIPTATAVTDKITSLGLTQKPREMVINDNSTMLPGTLAATHSVRNTDQVKYQQKKIRDEVRLTTNHIESIIAVQNETGNFVRDLRLQPLFATLMADEMKNEVQRVLENMPIEKALETGEDSVFGTGDFNITTLSMKHPMLERKNMSTNQLFPEPVIPIAMQIHDRRLGDDHKLFLYHIGKAIDEKYSSDNLASFKNKNMILVADGEFHDKELWSFAKPNLNTIKTAACWNHLRQNLEFKLNQYKCGEEQLREADIDLTWLLQSKTQDQYEDRKQQLREKGDDSIWNKAEVKEYFDKHLEPKIKMGAVYYLESIGFENFEHGCTSNSAESYNQVLKYQSQNKTHSIGEKMLILSYHQKMAAQECELAFYDRGPYQLKPEYAHLAKPLDEFPGTEIATVNEMKKRIREALALETAGDPLFMNLDEPPPTRPTVETIAQQIYEKNKIQLLTEDNRFIVEGLGQQKFIVDLGTFTCECGMKTGCAHVRAVLRKCNLAQDFGDPKRLEKGYRKPAKAAKRRNFRERKSGKKKPRKEDFLPIGIPKKKRVTLALNYRQGSTNAPANVAEAEADDVVIADEFDDFDSDRMVQIGNTVHDSTTDIGQEVSDTAIFDHSADSDLVTEAMSQIQEIRDINFDQLMDDNSEITLHVDLVQAEETSMERDSNMTDSEDMVQTVILLPVQAEILDAEVEVVTSADDVIPTKEDQLNAVQAHKDEMEKCAFVNTTEDATTATGQLVDTTEDATKTTSELPPAKKTTKVSINDSITLRSLAEDCLRIQHLGTQKNQEKQQNKLDRLNAEKAQTTSKELMLNSEDMQDAQTEVDPLNAEEAIKEATIASMITRDDSTIHDMSSDTSSGPLPPAKKPSNDNDNVDLQALAAHILRIETLPTKNSTEDAQKEADRLNAEQAKKTIIEKPSNDVLAQERNDLEAKARQLNITPEKVQLFEDRFTRRSSIARNLFAASTDSTTETDREEHQSDMTMDKKVVDEDLDKEAQDTTENEAKDEDEVVPRVYFTKNEELRNTAWRNYTKEQKQFFHNEYEKKMRLNGFNRHPDSISLDSNNEILGETPQLNGIYTNLTIYDKKGNECNLVSIDHNQAVLFTKDDRIADEQLTKTCAKIVGNGEVVKGGNVRRKVIIGKRYEKYNLKEKAEKLCTDMIKFDYDKSAKHSPIENIKNWKNFGIYCHCNEVRPVTQKIASDLITCSTCKEKYHTTCVNNKSTSFVCTSCNVNTEGLKWSANKGVTNTCSIDNTFTHMAIRCEKSPQFKKEIEKMANQLETEDNFKKIAFAKTVLLTAKNDSGAAQSLWAKTIVRHQKERNLIQDTPNPIDLFGGTDESLFQYVEELGTWYVEDLEKCSHCDYQNPYLNEENEIRIPFTTNPVAHFKYESSACQVIDSPCEQTHCTGTVTKSTIMFKEGTEKPLWLKVQNQGSLVGPEKFLDMPQEVCVGDETYQLGSIVLFNEDSNHFTSLQAVNGEFIFYDGLWKQKGKHHRMLAKTDYIGPNICVDHVLYVRCFNNETI